ncbi:MAG: rod shape-determining protein [Clostridiales bacterium]|nr:rod shape-determining protein [Clostridiales bacterium]
MGLFNFLNRDIGVDLGTANTLVFVKGKGVTVREPSVVAIDENTGQVLAVGNKAKMMIGRTPGNIKAIRPLKDGVIADFDITQTMLKHLISSSISSSFLLRPRVIVGVPSGVTDVERRAVEEAAYAAGAKEVYILEEPMAAAIGSGLPVDEPRGSMIVDIGGGTTDIAVISLGGIVTSVSLRVGGDKMDESIIQYAKRNFNLLIGERTAEEVKIKIGCAYMTREDNELGNVEIKGRDLMTGLPKTIAFSTREIMNALEEPVHAIVNGVRTTLENAPPELSADIIESGIVLTGGGALLKGLDILLSEETGIKVIVSENPLECVALGTGISVEHIEKMKKKGYANKKY